MDVLTNAARTVRMISQRLSLRPPQATSLEIVDDVLSRVDIRKLADPKAALEAIQVAYPHVEDFERDFPSLCFAVATGVGKTRLMGAFISYLYLMGKSRHFFVLAPNTTIYNKLIEDFSPDSPKYVFRGIAEFAQNPPLIITGDNYEAGRGVRLDRGRSADLFGGDVHINIFNIDKINKEESPRGKPKMRSIRETIGESYYAYLSKLTDLILIMDEAHRYRASAGATAIDGLKPILGLELTATPRTVGANSRPFKNVIYSYDLAQAMADGFVKEPYAASRANFSEADAKKLPEAELERIKLEDAVHNHDHTAVELDRYHRVTGRPRVQPFILVVAQNTEHARQLRAFIESEAFFKGRFKDKVAEVHSAQKGEESEEAMQRLVALERDGRTEIVIHVNKLKEGWDVTNLYTIVPLRAAASDILTEQTLGRGLRLPYGTRVAKGENDEFAALDRLTIIAHDRFDELIQRAREPGSIVMRQLRIGADTDVSSAGAVLVEAPSVAEAIITGHQPTIPGLSAAPQPGLVLKSAEESRTAELTLDVIRRYERKLGSADALRDTSVQKQIAAEVGDLIRPIQGALTGIIEPPRVEAIVAAVATTVADRTISIPQITVVPKRQVTFRFADFDLTDLATINMTPVDDALVMQSLRTEARAYLAKTIEEARESRMEDYLVRYLIEQNEIDYDAHSDFLYKLSGQVVDRLRAYLTSEPDVENVLLRNGRQLADFIFAQMMQHYRETPLAEDDYEVRVTRGFTLLKPQALNMTPGQKVRDFRHAVTPLSDTRKQVFGGFKKCCHLMQKFDSDPERRLALLVDAEPSVEKWLKPGRGQFQIEYRSGEGYEPDFVVETKTRSFILEVKAVNELSDPDVVAKAAAASKWCKTANAHVEAAKAKPWTYALIPDDQIGASATLEGLAARFSR